MKRKYDIISYDNYYSSGGLSNVYGSRDTYSEALELCGRFAARYDTVQIIDRDTWKILFSIETSTSNDYAVKTVKKFMEVE